MDICHQNSGWRKSSGRKSLYIFYSFTAFSFPDLFRFSFSIFYRLSPYNFLTVPFIPPPLSPLESGSHPETALPPYCSAVRTCLLLCNPECEKDHPLQLSPVKLWPVRLLARNLCLIPQPCLRLCSTATDLISRVRISIAQT